MDFDGVPPNSLYDRYVVLIDAAGIGRNSTDHETFTFIIILHRVSMLNMYVNCQYVLVQIVRCNLDLQYPQRQSIRLHTNRRPEQFVNWNFHSLRCDSCP